MFILGVVGGVASGKSFVARELEKLGAVILNADAVGHEVLQDPEVITAFRQRWGEAVINSAGEIIRAEVARRVFGTGDAFAAEREFLNQTTHPRIRRKLLAELAEHRARQLKLVVVDAALLFETGWDTLCDGVLFVDSPRDQRLARALARGWTEEQFIARESAQWTIKEKRNRARWVLDNSRSQEEAVNWLQEWFSTTII